MVGQSSRRFNSFSLRLLLFIILSLGIVAIVFYLGKVKENFINGEKPKIVLYFTTWCPHCKAFMSEWNKVTVAAASLGVSAVSIDGDKSKKLVAKKNIDGFPTIRLEKDGKEIEYDGPRTADGVINFVKSKMA